jgi:hypothetical protein
MSIYRVYFIDPDKHISRPPEILDCADDKEAAHRALAFVNGLDLEVWSLGRLVVRFPRNPDE